MLQETFERAKAWVKELQRQASPNIVIALAGNKADLAEKRLVEYEVSSAALVLPKNVVLQNLDDTVTFMWNCICISLFQDAQTYAEDIGLLFMETSAKTAMNVSDLFFAIG